MANINIVNGAWEAIADTRRRHHDRGDGHCAADCDSLPVARQRTAVLVPGPFPPCATALWCALAQEVMADPDGAGR